METRKCFVLLMVMAILPLWGCQKSATARDEQWTSNAGSKAAVAPTAEKVLPGAQDGETEKPPACYTTQRRRNPQTGRIETVRVPVTPARFLVSEVDKKPAPYAEPIIFDHPVDPVYFALYNWAAQAGFDIEGASGRDKFFGHINCHTESRIHFRFEIALVDTSKTKLRIHVENHEGKDEFEMIRKSLKDALAGLKGAAGNTSSDVPDSEKSSIAP